MQYESKTIENLLEISLDRISRYLKRGGTTLQKIEETVSSGKYVSFRYSWKVRTTRGSRVVSEDNPEIELSFRKESGVLYMEISYTLQREGIESPHSLQFVLIKKESNLIPGSYRYYISDRWSDRPEALCSKLYFWRGDFVTRSVLKSLGVLYKQQREGHTCRSVWTPYHRIPEGKDLKYRKTHYRGRETRFYKRYNRLYEKGERSCLEYLAKSFPIYLESLPPFGLGIESQ